MKSTTTATPIAYPPAPQPPVFVQRSVEWLEASQSEVDDVEQSIQDTLTDYLKSVPLETILEALERIEGIKIFTAPDLSPEEADLSLEEADPESIAQVYALASLAEKRAKDHKESLKPAAEIAMMQWLESSGQKTLETQSANVTMAWVTIDSQEVGEARLVLKQAEKEALKQSACYQQKLRKFEETKEKFKGEQKPVLRVKLWEEI